MDYFIIKRRRTIKIGESEPVVTYDFFCANSVIRCKSSHNEDITTFVCSGFMTAVPTEEIVGIFPTTPPDNWK